MISCSRSLEILPSNCFIRALGLGTDGFMFQIAKEFTVFFSKRGNVKPDNIVKLDCSSFEREGLALQYNDLTSTLYGCGTGAWGSGSTSVVMTNSDVDMTGVLEEQTLAYYFGSSGASTWAMANASFVYVSNLRRGYTKYGIPPINADHIDVLKGMPNTRIFTGTEYIVVHRNKHLMFVGRNKNNMCGLPSISLDYYVPPHPVEAAPIYYGNMRSIRQDVSVAAVADGACFILTNGNTLHYSGINSGDFLGVGSSDIEWTEIPHSFQDIIKIDVCHRSLYAQVSSGEVFVLGDFAGQNYASWHSLGYWFDFSGGDAQIITSTMGAVYVFGDNTNGMFTSTHIELMSIPLSILSEPMLMYSYK